ncbi:MAG: lysine-sensitive aspartokinase 3 [Bacteriovoracaceae bacterium]|jgi:aspartate kinase|nr:lysine-sensitive aspartokinase 3 [Bacteriovoracaceae bacterium]
MSTTVVAKFGGTSMGSKKAMEKCGETIKAYPDLRVVLVSATSGTTNILVELAKLSIYGEKNQARIEQLLKDLEEKHLSMASDIGVRAETLKKIEELVLAAKNLAIGMSLLCEASLQATDSLLSIGERLSSLLFTELLQDCGINATWLDIREVMKTNSDFGKAIPDLELIKTLAKEKITPLCENHVVITQGFIGSDEEGKTTTLGRGGSDYSAALIAEALDASTLQIWTDVPGLKTTDPRVVSAAIKIDEINFNESAELSTFGAKVLHPATLWPAIRKNIPVYVGNSQNHLEGGTWVRPKSKNRPLVRALAMRRQQKLLTLTSLEMVHAPGFLAKVFTILARHKISVDLVTTSEVNVAITLDEPTSLTRDVARELKEHCHIQLEENLCLIAVIGNDIAHTPKLVGEIFKVTSEHSIRLICHGAGQHNLCFLVKRDEAENILKNLHKHFIENPVDIKPTQACPGVKL